MMGNLRCISFGMEYCWRSREMEKDKPLKQYSLIDLLVYNFYLPLFANGPVVDFDTFQRTVSGFVNCNTSPKAFVYTLIASTTLLLNRIDSLD